MQSVVADSGVLQIDHIGAGVGIFLYSPEKKNGGGTSCSGYIFPGAYPTKSSSVREYFYPIWT